MTNDVGRTANDTVSTRQTQSSPSGSLVGGTEFSRSNELPWPFQRSHCPSFLVFIAKERVNINIISI